jgi:retinol dehydrogenase 12
MNLLGTGVRAFSLHPGVVQTELGRHLNESKNRMIHNSFQFFGRYFFKTAEMGAQTTIYCATENSLISGHYYR